MPLQARLELYRKALLSDVFLSSVNAIATDGTLLCEDAIGNRAAALLFGPNMVYVIAGINKVVDNMEEGFRRIRKIASMNALRISHEVPCIHTGICEDCHSPKRICNQIAIIDDVRNQKERFHVVLINEVFGY